MRSKRSKNLWEFREASPIKPHDRFILLMLISAGTICILNFANWWFREDHVANYPLFVILSLFFWYSTFRIILIWINYLRLKKPDSVPVPPDDLRVAIFTTSAPGEPL